MDNKSQTFESAPINVDGRKQWVRYKDIAYPNSWFNDAAAHLLKTEVITKFQIGDAWCISLPAKQTVDAVIAWRKLKSDKYISGNG